MLAISVVATRWFRPRHPLVPASTALSVIQEIRFWLGLLIVLCTATAFSRSGVSGVPRQQFEESMLTPMFGGPLIAFGALALVLATPAARRGFPAAATPTRHGGARAGRGRGMYLLAVLSPYGPVDDALTGLVFPLDALLWLVWRVIWWPLLIVFGGFVLISLYLCGKPLFNAAEAHPLLGPIVGAVIAWTITVIGLLTGDPDGVPPALHHTVQRGGPCAVTVLGIAEWLVYQMRYGVRVRTGPWPAYGMTRPGAGASSQPMDGQASRDPSATGASSR